MRPRCSAKKLVTPIAFSGKVPGDIDAKKVWCRHFSVGNREIENLTAGNPQLQVFPRNGTFGKRRFKAYFASPR